MKSALTPARRARLEKLAAYLDGLPPGYRHFDMLSWMKPKSSVKEAHYARHNGSVNSCGSVACAVGHGPAAGIFVPENFISRQGRVFFVDWEEYAKELFAGNDSNSFWMFSSTWAWTDNTPTGAAARIRYLLAHGEPPAGFGLFPRREHIPLYAPYRIDAKERASA